MIDPPKVGQVFQNRYLILSELGKGGSGLVYKAKQVDADRDVAIKTLRPEKRAESETVARFFREFRLLSTLLHPNLMTVYGVALDADSSPYAICEFIEGCSLRTFVYSDERLSWERIVKILLQICSACEYAHSQGVIHRDLKPDNIILQDRPSADFVKILDFGLSKAFVETPADAKLTMTGQLIGTPHYMSPEQAGMKSDARTDIYALGCIAFELIKGEHLFDADSSMGIIYKQINEDAQERLSTVESKLPKKLFAVISQMLEKNIEQRFQSMSDVSEELKTILADPKELISGKDWKTLADKVKYSKRGLRSSLIFAAVGILVLNCVFFILFFFHSKDQQTNLDQALKLPSKVQADIRQFESKGDFAGAVGQYVDLLKKSDLNEFERCYMFTKANECVSTALFLSLQVGTEFPLAREALFISNGALQCAVKKRDFGSFSGAVSVRYKALQLLHEDEQNEKCWYDACKLADATWGPQSKAAIQIRYSAGLAFLNTNHIDAAAEMVRDCLQLIESGIALEQDKVLSIKCIRVLILHKKGQDAEALLRLKECDQEFLQLENATALQRRMVLEHLLINHSQLNQLESFEELLAQDAKENANLYKNSHETEVTSKDLVGRHRSLDVPALMYLNLAMKYSEQKKHVDAFRNYKKAYSSFNQNLKETASDRYDCLEHLRNNALALGKSAEAREYQAQIQKMLAADPNLVKYTNVNPD